MLAVAVGIGIGVGTYTFLYARGASYLTNRPEACANCHVMSEHYGAWVKSSHRNAAVCNDCHTPDALLPKYAVKASNGFWHSFAFTSGRFPDTLRIKARNLRVTEQACRRCHDAIVQAIDGPHPSPPTIGCVHCHASVGHLTSPSSGIEAAAARQ